jgi:hypothetical protein
MSLGSRYLNQFQYTLEKDTVTLFGSFEVDGYGAVTHYQGGGVASVAAVDATTGQFDITLQDGWDYLFEVTAQVVQDTISSVAAIQLLMDPTTLQTDIKNKVPLRIVCLNYAGSAVDPATSASVRFKIVVRRSSYAPFDTGTTV